MNPPTHLRSEWESTVDPYRTVVLRDESGLRWWTWAGRRANATLHAALTEVAPHAVGDTRAVDNLQIPLGSQITAADLTAALDELLVRLGPGLMTVNPEVTQQSVNELKFNDLLPHELAVSTLANRMADRISASRILRRPIAQRISA